MKVGNVIGNIWATRKEALLEGYKLLLVQPIDVRSGAPDGAPLVAADTIGAGVGERVLIVSGSSARSAAREDNTPIDATIVGIVDDLELEVGS